jgi:hypothetical protein
VVHKLLKVRWFDGTDKAEAKIGVYTIFPIRKAAFQAISVNPALLERIPYRKATLVQCWVLKIFGQLVVKYFRYSSMWLEKLGVVYVVKNWINRS